MAKRYLLGLDVGGGSLSALLLGAQRDEVFVVQRSLRPQPAQGEGLWAFSLDTRLIWDLLGSAVREVLFRAKADPQDVVGLAAAGTRHTLVALDRQGEVLFALPNRDARAAAEASELGADQGEAFYRCTGHWPAPIFTAVRLLWLKKNRPDLLQQAHRVLSLSDWIAFKLCGEAATDFSQAADTLLLDLSHGTWARDLAHALGLDVRLFPPVLAAGTRVGEITKETAPEWGLAPGTTVAMGGADSTSALLGGGAVDCGDVGCVAGTTLPVLQVLDQPAWDRKRRLWTSHLLPDRWTLESNAGPTGEALEWFAGLLYPYAPQPAAALFAEAARSVPGARGMLSDLGVQIFNAAALSMPIANLTFSPLTLASAGEATAQAEESRRHLARAVAEGIAFGVKANLEQILEVSSISPTTVFASGGLSRSRFFLQLLSDVLGKEVTSPERWETAAMGAALCAGVGAGVFQSLTWAAKTVRSRQRVFHPDPQAHAIYQTLYEAWRQIHRSRQEADTLAAGIALQALTIQEEATSGGAFRPRIYVSAPLDEPSLEALGRLGEVTYCSYREQQRLLNGDDLVETLQGYHVFVTEADLLDAGAIERLPDLRVVVACRGNAVNVDITACTAMQIPVIAAPGRNSDAVADLTLAFLLMLARKLPQAATFLREPGGAKGDLGRQGRAHETLQGHELWRKTVGLVGLGAVGRKVARRLFPFGPRILVYDPYLSEEEASAAGTELVPLDELIRKSDFISLHAPVTEETRGLFDQQAFEQMKPGAFLVNTARAALVVEEALYQSLASGHLGGAALDVFSVEPPGADHPLLSLPNVIATPHVGGNTFEVAAHQGEIVVEELKRLLEGKNPRTCLNPDTLSHFRWEGDRARPNPAEMARLKAGPPPAVSDLELEGEAAAIPSTQVEVEAPAAPQAPPKKSAVEKMTRLLKVFLDKIARDDKLLSFAKGKNVTVHYTIPDLRLAFFICFQNGAITSGLGAPPQKAEVNIKMNADVLDGVFTGRVHPMKAATSGQLAFSGNTLKAMSLQRIQQDLIRLYLEARGEAGEPLRFSPASRENAARTMTQQETSQIPPSSDVLPLSPGQLTGPTASDERHEMVEIIRELHALQLITSTGGNVSARRSARPEEAWITPSAMHKGTLAPERIVRIDLQGNVLDPSAPAPSSERHFHCAVLRARPDVNAVIHSHAPKATALALAELPFFPISTEAAFVGEIPRVPFIMPGTEELARAVAQALGKGPAVLMQNHGLIVAASSLRRASDLTQIIEQTCGKILDCYAVRKTPPVLPEETVRLLREMGEMVV